MLKMKFFKLLLSGALFYLVTGNGFCQKGSERLKILSEFKMEESVIYKTVNGKKLKLVLFLPKGEQKEKMPVMLYTHGGGWRGGDVYKILKPAFLGALRQMSDAGIACASINYRLSKGGSTVEDSVKDCKDAARFLMKNGGRWNLDTEKMGIWGGSAGGHLALMTGLADNGLFLGDEKLKDENPEFRCVVSYYPLTSFTQMDLLKGSNFEDPTIFVPMLGGLPAEVPEVAKKLSPVSYISEKMPPVLLIHGEKDRVLPISQSKLFLELAKEAKASVDFIAVRGAGHSLRGKRISPSMEKVNASAAEFILENLK